MNRRIVVDDRGNFIPEPKAKKPKGSGGLKGMKYRAWRERQVRIGRAQKIIDKNPAKAFCEACGFQRWAVDSEGNPRLDQDDKLRVMNQCGRCGYDRLQQAPAVPWHPAIVNHIEILRAQAELGEYVYIPDWADDVIADAFEADPSTREECPEEGCTVDVQGLKREIWGDGSIVYRGKNLLGRVAIRHKHPGKGVMARVANARWNPRARKARAAEKQRKEFGAA